MKSIVLFFVALVLCFVPINGATYLLLRVTTLLQKFSWKKEANGEEMQMEKECEECEDSDTESFGYEEMQSAER